MKKSASSSAGGSGELEEDEVGVESLMRGRGDCREEAIGMKRGQLDAQVGRLGEYHSPSQVNQYQLLLNGYVPSCSMRDLIMRFLYTVPGCSLVCQYQK